MLSLCFCIDSFTSNWLEMVNLTDCCIVYSIAVGLCYSTDWNQKLYAGLLFCAFQNQIQDFLPYMCTIFWASTYPLVLFPPFLSFFLYFTFKCFSWSLPISGSHFKLLFDIQLFSSFICSPSFLETSVQYIFLLFFFTILLSSFLVHLHFLPIKRKISRHRKLFVLTSLDAEEHI